LSRKELEYWLEEREEFRIEFNEAWNKMGIWDEETRSWKSEMDAVICPVGPGLATRHGTAKYFAYSAVWNLLDYPALAFPAGIADKRVDAAVPRTEFMTDYDMHHWAQCKDTVYDQCIIAANRLVDEPDYFDG